jgi:hypothetical protein
MTAKKALKLLESPQPTQEIELTVVPKILQPEIKPVKSWKPPTPKPW